jgi:hypothetical protein
MRGVLFMVSIVEIASPAISRVPLLGVVCIVMCVLQTIDCG